MNDVTLMRTYLARREAKRTALDLALCYYELDLVLTLEHAHSNDLAAGATPLQDEWSRARREALHDAETCLRGESLTPTRRCELCPVPELVPALIVPRWVVTKRRCAVARARAAGRAAGDPAAEAALLITDPSEAVRGPVYELREVGGVERAIDVTPPHLRNFAESDASHGQESSMPRAETHAAARQRAAWPRHRLADEIDEFGRWRS